MPEFTLPEKLYLNFLELDKNYEVTVLDRVTPTAGIMKKEPEWLNKKITIRGDCISKIGIQLPVMYPDSIMIVHLKAR